VAVLTLALGTGANTAIFGLVNSVLLKSLPVREPERLFFLQDPTREKSDVFGRADFEQIRARNQVFSGVCTFTGGDQMWNASIDGQSEPVRALLVSGEYYDVAGVGAILGRTLSPSDDLPPAGSAVATIGYGFWEKRFARAPGVLGKSVRLNGGSFTIVGVMPPEFFGIWPGRTPDITIPHQAIGVAMPQRTANRNRLGTVVMGRLRPGITQAAAQAGMQTIYRQLLEEAGAKPREISERKLALVPAAHGVAELRLQFSKPLLALMVLVGLLLALACANVANLVMARNSARTREIAVRLAVGAGRGQLIRQLLIESLMLSTLGGIGGVLLAVWTRDLMPAVSLGSRLQLPMQAPIDFSVLAFTMALAIVTGLVFGLAPALRATRLDLTHALKGKGTAAGRSVGKPLMVAQVALSMLLLIGAGLFARSLRNLASVDAGFRRDGVLMFRIDPTLRGYRDARYYALLQGVLDAVASVPGVRSASLSDATLLGGGHAGAYIQVEGQPRDEDRELLVNWVSPAFFETVGMTMVAGRGFTAADQGAAPHVAVINQAMARRYFAGQQPVGRRFRWSDDQPPIEIVGVTRDAKYDDLRSDAAPTFFVPLFAGAWQRAKTVEVLAAGDPAALTSAIRRQVAQVDPDLMLFDVRTLAGQARESMAEERLTAGLSTLLGVLALALALACVGLYGVMAFHTVRRTSEIGVRMALGARPADVIRMVLREAVGVVGLGVAIAVPIALVLGRLAASLLYGVSAWDFRTIAMAAAVMFLSAMGAAWLPARRAAHVDPLVALGYDG
jgi:predicted permease